MKKTKIKDILNYEFLSSLLASEDGKKLAYKKTKANYDDNKYETDLWIYDIDLSKTYQVTDTKEASLFTFDKDSNLVYKAKSDEQKDYFRVTDGLGIGEIAFSLDKDVKSIKWLKDDIYLIHASEKKDKETKESEKKNQYFHELDTLPFWLNGAGYLKWEESTYYLYDSKKDKLKKLIDNNFKNDIHVLNINDDLSKLVYITAYYDDHSVYDMKGSLCLYDIEEKKSKLLIDREFSYYYADFLGDNIIFVGSDQKKHGVNQDSFIYISDFDGNYTKITDDDFDMDFANSLGTDARFGSARAFQVKNDKLYFVVTEKEDSKLYAIDKDGNISKELDEEVEDFIVTDENIYYLSMRRDTLAELKDKNTGKILVKNRIESDVCDIETFEFYSNDDTLTGFVILPPNFGKDKKYPTLLSVHGGPKTEFGEIFHHEHQVFASDGYIVIYTNPHGASGNGVAFSDIRGLYGDKDYEDLMNFVDEASRRYPQIDTESMGIYGGSYGGFMTNWVIGHTDKFKAACSQRSISNWTSFYGVSDIGYYFAPDQTGADPWESIEKLWDKSPIKYADKAKTPTLFIHADEDYRCPLEQGLQMYTKLKLNGVDTKMFVFHGENHELSRSGKPQPRIKRLKEIKKWFDGYLK